MRQPGWESKRVDRSEAGIFCDLDECCTVIDMIIVNGQGFPPLSGTSITMD
jgi:hypothetical protein